MTPFWKKKGKVPAQSAGAKIDLDLSHIKAVYNNNFTRKV